MHESHTLRYDPERDPFLALNDPSLLDETPLGTLRVVTWGNRASVAVMHPQDPTRVQRIIHTLKRGQSPLDAIYGKRTFEQAAVRALYDQRDVWDAESEARDDDDLSKAFTRELETFVRRHEDGDEAVAGALGAPVQLADGSFMSFRIIRPEKASRDG